MAIQDITLGDNTYTINTDSDNLDYVRDILEAEIKFQYRKYNFELRKNSDGSERSLKIYIANRRLPNGTVVQSFEYSPDYGLIKNTSTIRCYSKDILKSMSDVITKFIQRCEETIILNNETSNSNQDFINELNRTFPHAKIDYNDSSRWPGHKNNAKIHFDNGHIDLHHDDQQELTAYITIDESSRQNIYAVINKLLK